MPFDLSEPCVVRWLRKYVTIETKLRETRIFMEVTALINWHIVENIGLNTKHEISHFTVIVRAGEPVTVTVGGLSFLPQVRLPMLLVAVEVASKQFVAVTFDCNENLFFLRELASSCASQD